MAAALGTFENASGRHYQSATESSWNTWSNGSGVGGDRNVTISYYNNGAMLGAMLDLKIRESSGNRKSLDDVMRGLYKTYYLEKRRGFTDAEFREECERAAGAGLAEIFVYASTSREVDYTRYFALAGLKLEWTVKDAPGGYLGLDTHTEELPPAETPAAGRGGRGRGGAPATRLVVTEVPTSSPAEAAALKAGDVIEQVESEPASATALSAALLGRKAGDHLRLRIRRGAAEQEIDAKLAGNTVRTYKLSLAAEGTPRQSAILRDWLRVAQ
jgi:predicted metalloprotease with PDZ domain